MTKTLKELQEEHPEWCFRCGHREMSAPFHSCFPAHVINILTAAKREDEERLAPTSRRLKDGQLAFKDRVAELEWWIAVDEDEWPGGPAEIEAAYLIWKEKAAHLQSQLTAAQEKITELGLKRAYPHMCRDEHPEIGHSDSENEMCPLCIALSQLTAEREAHAATKEELWDAQETIQQQAWELREVDQAALARQSQRAALKGESHD